MARKTIEKITSDLSGDELEDGTDSLQFGFDGTQYEIDVTAKERRELEKALAKFIEAGRRIPQRSSTKRSRATGGPDPKAVRQWAQDSGIDVPSRGRIPANVLEAYSAAN